ncbi:hypothetical protein J3R83DRAFT_5318 [Lanmaoa asiatica]|nr:hypothetical protein J3R83DRAFT_5318 [Lanmaoa asiatica]
MHSFASVLIAAALATLSSAAPVGLPRDTLSVPVSPPIELPSVPLPTGTIPSVGQLNSVDVRADIPSVAVIFNNILTETQPYTEQLTYIVPSNCTITEITNIVSSIKAPIVAAIPQLEALVGQEASAILAPVSGVAGDAELTVSEIASIVGSDVGLILVAAGNVLNVANAQGGDIVADAKDVLADLGSTVTSLVGAVVPLVNGLAASLTPVMAPVDSVVSELDLGELAIILGLTI